MTHSDDSCLDFRCRIDFVSSPALNANQDIMFHLGVRLDEKVIVRNSYAAGRWGMEERYGKCLIKRDKPFEIVILAEHQYYKIAINGQHLGVFRHHLPLHLVRFVHISTDVPGVLHVENILFEQDLQSAREQVVLAQIGAPPSYTPYAPQPPIFVQGFQPHQPMMPMPPPQYYGHQHNTVRRLQNPTSNKLFSLFQSITRIGAVTIERRPGQVVVKQNNRPNNVFRF